MRGWNRRGIILVTMGLAFGGVGMIHFARVFCVPGGHTSIPPEETIRATQDLEALERFYKEKILPLREASLRHREQLDALLSSLEGGIGWSDSNRALTSSSDRPSRPGLNKGPQGTDLLKTLEQARIWEGGARRAEDRYHRDLTERADLGR